MQSANILSVEVFFRQQHNTTQSTLRAPGEQYEFVCPFDFFVSVVFELAAFAHTDSENKQLSVKRLGNKNEIVPSSQRDLIFECQQFMFFEAFA